MHDRHSSLEMDCLTTALALYVLEMRKAVEDGWCDPKPEMVDRNTSPFRVPSPGVRCTCHEASGSFGCEVRGDA